MIHSEIEIRLHYRNLKDMGFSVMQGNDIVDEEDFVAIGLENGTVDLWKDGKCVSTNTAIGASGDDRAAVA